MRSLKVILALCLILTACKTRQVAVSKTDSTSVKSSVTASNEVKKGIDSSKSTITTDMHTNKVIHLQDSTGVTTDITPHPGTQSTVDDNGTFHGQADKVTTTKHSKTSSDKTINSDVQQKASEIKAIDTTDVKASSAIVRDSTHVQSKIKTVKATPSYGWIIYLSIGLLLFLGAAWYYVKHIA